MRKCCLLLLLLPLAVLGNRPPAAVFEDVFELGRPTAAFLATTESRNGMKAYLRKKYRQLRDPVPQASTMAAYTAAHERYQNSEEKRHDRIRMENLRKLASVRTKRLDPVHQGAAKKAKRIDIVPREVFKFELADAMVFHRPESDSAAAVGLEAKVRTKREEQQVTRVEPVPREIIRFELGDAIVSSGKTGRAVNGSADAGATRSGRRRRAASPEPRDHVRFELADARVPGNFSSAPTVTENLRHPFTSSDSYKRGKVFDEVVERPEASGRRPPAQRSRKEKRESASQLQVEDQLEDGEPSDMSPEESRRVKVRGGKKPKQVANYEDLPPGVQKAIDIAIKENERLNVKGREDGTTVAQPTPKYFFGDKKPKTKKPYSSATAKITEPKFVPSAKLSETKLPSIEEVSNGQTGFIPSKGIGLGAGGPHSVESGEASKAQSGTVQGIPKTWWSYSDHRRPKRLYHKSSAQPLVISPQYVNTFKPAGEQSTKMNDLSPGYHHRRPVLFSPASGTGSSGSASGEHLGYEGHLSSGPAEEVIIKERPKIQYVIKEIPVPVQVKQPRTKITVQPSISISYDKDITSPASGEGSAGRGYDNPYGPIELQYDHRQQPTQEPAKSFQSMKIVVPDPKDESREHEQYYEHGDYVHGGAVASTQSPPTHSNEIDTTGSSIAALSALIGQRPSVQLKGLSELLQMPIAMGNHQQLHQQQQHPQHQHEHPQHQHEHQHQQQQYQQQPQHYQPQPQLQHRPQDSTAPITFPESSTPTPKPSRPGYRSVQIEHGPKIVYDDSLYHTVQMNPQLQVPMSKEYTPIKEDVPDIPDSDLIGPTVATPTHATYIISSPKSTPAPIVEHHEFNEEEAGHETNSYRHINIHSTPSPPLAESVSHHYQEQHHHHHHHHDSGDEHYDVRATAQDSEGYAFGYRVRDFHTGNDFGHVQNHDNGVTRGEYHILLPDGRVQNVRYTADEKGFHADVTYESVHPSSHNRK